MLNLTYSPSHIVCIYNETKCWQGFRRNAWIEVARDRASQWLAIEYHFLCEYHLGVVSIVIWRHA